MKRSICVLIALILLILSGCNTQQKTEYKNASFFYCIDTVEYDTQSSIFAAEERMVNIDPNNIIPVINLYLNGPLDDHFTSAFVPGVSVADLTIEGQTANIILSSTFARLSGIDLTVACSCLTLTLAELLGTERVVISADGLQLDGKESITMHVNDIIFWDSIAQSDAPNGDNRGV